MSTQCLDLLDKIALLWVILPLRSSLGSGFLARVLTPVGVHLHCCSWAFPSQAAWCCSPRKWLVKLFRESAGKIKCILPGASKQKKIRHVKKESWGLGFEKWAAVKYLLVTQFQNCISKNLAECGLKIACRYKQEFTYSSPLETTTELCCYEDPDCRCFASLLLLECLMPACVFSWYGESVYIFNWNANFLLMVYEQRFCVCVA